MQDSDQQDSDSLYPSDFDITRLECMSIGDRIDGELGNWTVFRYKNDYLLFINICKVRKSDWEFDKVEDLIKFLKKRGSE